MKKIFQIKNLVLFACAIAGSAVPAKAQVDVLTHHYNNENTGFNTSETVLNASNVNTTTFGKAYEFPVTGHVYAQPLYVKNLNIGGKIRNVLFVATMHNDVYAFDADDPTLVNAPLWHVTLGQSVRIKSRAIGADNWENYNDIAVETGILSTPVIDKTSATIYVMAKNDETIYPNGVFNGTLADTSKVFDRLHALDLLTGLDKTGSPVTVRGSVPGNGADDGPADGIVAFHSSLQNQRSALKLSPDGGRVYACSGSYGDGGPYHGWIFGFNTGNLSQKPLIFCTTPEGTKAGIWMSGAGPAIDANGDLYVITGDGSFDSGNAGRKNYGNSFLRLSPNPGAFSFDVRTFFTPYNFEELNEGDVDLGSDGPLLLANNQVTGSGKEGKMYLLNRTSMGGYNANSDQVLQSFQAFDGHLHGTAVFLPTTGNDGYSYWWSENNFPKRYDLTNGRYNTTAVQGNIFANHGMPGGHLTVTNGGPLSANNPPILWANIPTAADANQAVVNGTLRAFNGNTMQQIWYSDQVLDGSERLGKFAKFVSPTVTNGKVYMATFSNKVIVYGLKGAPPFTIAASASSACSGQTVTLTAISCGGTVNWSTGSQNTSIVVGAGIYTATCTVNNLTSVPASFTVGTGVSTNLTKVRIYPRPDCCAGRTLGARIQVSSGGSGGPWQTVMIVPSEKPGQWSEFTLSGVSGNYNALRYLAPEDGAYTNVAEVEFYNGATKLTGTAFGDGGGPWNGRADRSFDKALDGNVATYYDGNDSNNGYVGFTLISECPSACSLSAVVSATAPTCGGGSTLSVAVGGGSGGAVSYAWSGPNNFTSTLASPQLTNLTAAMAGSYSVTLTQSGCSSAPASVSLDFICASACSLSAVVSATAPTCGGGSTLSVAVGGSSGGAVSYAWSGPNNFTSTLASPQLSNLTAGMAGTYAVSVTQSGCTATAGTTLSFSCTLPPVVSACALTKVRIYPRPDCCTGRTIGAQIQVSTTGSGGPWQTVLSIASEKPGQWSEFNLSGVSGNYNALRYLSPTGGYTNLAEVEFYNGATKLTGTGFGDGGGAWSGAGNSFDKALDGNVATYYDGNNSNGGYVGLSLTNCGGTPSACSLSAVVSATTPTCGGGSTLSVAVGGSSGGAVSYAWSGPNNFTSTLASPQLSNLTAGMAGSYAVVLTQSGCSSAPASVNLDFTCAPPPVASACALTKVRIYPRPDCCAGRTIGARIQVSSGGSSGPWQTVLTVPSESPNQWSEFTLSGVSGNYNALRYLSAMVSHTNVAEVEFYNGATKLTGTAFGDGGGPWNGSGNTFDKALDGNVATYYDANDLNNGYVGMSLSNCGGTNRLAAEGIFDAENTLFKVSINPNPSSGRASVLVTLPKAGLVNLSLLTSTGQVIQAQEWDGQVGKNSVEVDYSQYPNGLFLLRVQSQGQTAILKVIKIQD